ncbi:MAG: SDR family NAD(P)-dependent oxidoreductase, partial [Gammaproteobacteria bacterium]
MNILITGASGFIGQHLLKACLDHGHQVTACVRDTAQVQHYYPQAQVIQCDFAKDNDISVWLPRLTNIDVVINAVGIIQQRGTNTFDALHTHTPCALFKASEISHVSKVIQISALGADDTAFSQYHLSKKAADDFLSSLDLDWTILMPSLVYGPGAKSLRLFKAMAALPVTPLVCKGE